MGLEYFPPDNSTWINPSRAFPLRTFPLVFPSNKYNIYKKNIHYNNYNVFLTLGKRSMEKVPTLFYSNVFDYLYLSLYSF